MTIISPLKCKPTPTVPLRVQACTHSRARCAQDEVARFRLVPVTLLGPAVWSAYSAGKCQERGTAFGKQKFESGPQCRRVHSVGECTVRESAQCGGVASRGYRVGVLCGCRWGLQADKVKKECVLAYIWGGQRLAGVGGPNSLHPALLGSRLGSPIRFPLRLTYKVLA